MSSRSLSGLTVCYTSLSSSWMGGISTPSSSLLAIPSSSVVLWSSATFFKVLVCWAASLNTGEVHNKNNKKHELAGHNWEGYDSTYQVCSQLRSADVPRYTWIDLVKLCFARLSASCLNVDSSSKPFPSSQKVLVLSRDGQHICCAHDLHAVWFPYCIGQHYCNSSRSQYSWNVAILWLGMLQYFDWNVAILQHEMNGTILWLVECCNMTMLQYDNLEVWQYDGTQSNKSQNYNFISNMAYPITACRSRFNNFVMCDVPYGTETYAKKYSELVD